ncbi:MAG TPA: c-type cytochrome biogenesis protein CcsB [Drouetiella sp.]
MSDFTLALTNTAGVSSVASFWVFVASNGVKKWHDKMLKAAGVVMAVGFVALTLAIVARGFEAQRFPLANLYESLMWFAWATMGGYLALSTAYGIRQLGWLAALLAATMFLYGSWLPVSQQTITPLVPALVSYWRQIHVPPLIVSYAMFFLSGLSSLIQLYHARKFTSLGLAIGTIILACTAIGLGTFTTVDTKWLQLLFVGGSVGGTVAAWFTLKQTKGEPNTKQAETYDDVSYRAIAIGFPLLTIGIITGGLWANHAWGTYWSWDPKESMALVTWLSYAAYIHLRIHHEMNAEKLSLVSVAGLLLTLLTYLGFNSLGFGGLHSYGKFK